jgi:hypothetical protein
MFVTKTINLKIELMPKDRLITAILNKEDKPL